MIDRFRKPPLACSCGRGVIIEVQRDGARHETRSYMVRCDCGRIVEELPDNASGLKRDAIATWNRIRRSEILIGGNLSAVQRLVEPRDLVALPPPEIAPEQAHDKRERCHGGRSVPHRTIVLLPLVEVRVTE